ncbi:CoA transferase, partial [SAR202 cluster bacterium AD-802-E10_MRT_200m]|nr:CoA transferase [SAR202 cluster bacterium AD-802-E10_MRT_200m]
MRVPMNSNASTESILHGIKVLDLSWGIAGPITSMMLSDNGAEVIKIEPLTGDPFRSTPGYVVWGRGKKSLSLNLKCDKGKTVFTKLVQHADVVLESISSGISKKLDINYDTLSK